MHLDNIVVFELVENSEFLSGDVEQLLVFNSHDFYRHFGSVARVRALLDD